MKAAETSDRVGEMAAFCAVIEAGSITGGGARVGLSASGASRLIARLEQRLGVRLLIRSSRRLTPTEEGRTFYEESRRILIDLAEMEATLGNRARASGRLRVSASVALGRLHVLPLVPEFLRAYPDIVLDLSLSDHEANIAAGETDVAIRIGKLPDSGLTARKLGESPRLVVASPRYLEEHGVPSEPEALNAHNCIRFNYRRRQIEWPFMRDGTRFFVPVTGNIEVNSGDAMVELALAGHGIARVGRFHVAQALRDGRLVTLLEAFDAGETETFHAVFVGGANTPARMRAWIDFLAARWTAT